MRLEINKRAMGDIALRSAEARAWVAQEAETRAAALKSMVPDDEEIVVTHAGDSRACSYVRRLHPVSAARETRDGALSKVLGGGA